MANHDHHHTHSHPTPNNIRMAFFLNLGFTILEIVGGFLTNSVAILSDALHDLGDSLSLGLAWYLDNFSRKKRTKKFSYGYRRFSLLGALINAVVLIVGSLFILSEAMPRIISPEHSNAQGMIAFAIIGVLVNGFAAFRMKDDHSMNAQVVAWHLLEDVLGWVAVLIVGITLLFTDIHILDPILSVLITLYVLYNVIGNLRKTLDLFLQASPPDINIDEIEKQFLQIEQVNSVHHTHVWTLDGEHHVLSTHLVIDNAASKTEIMDIKSRSKKIIEPMNIEHITVEIEFEDEDCEMRET